MGIFLQRPQQLNMWWRQAQVMRSFTRRPRVHRELRARSGKSVEIRPRVRVFATASKAIANDLKGQPVSAVQHVTKARLYALHTMSRSNED